MIFFNYINTKLNKTHWITLLFSFFLLFYGTNRLNAVESKHQEAVSSISYLLSIDRLDYYNKSLADYLTGKQDYQLIEDLYKLNVDDYLKVKPDLNLLNQSEKWSEITAKILLSKHPERKYHKNIQTALIWNYNFLKNKLLERYKTRDFADNLFKWGELINNESLKSRTVPKIKGQKILLDYERYIAEKTSRAIIWDSIINDRDFEFHIGSKKDFLDYLNKSNLEIVQEILPISRNYNKIFLMYDTLKNKYSYAINQISGDDRVKHLSTQLRLLKVNGKSFFSNKDKVRIFGSAKKIHSELEANLVDIFNRLPKADRILFGQKSAIEDAIRAAGMADVIKNELPTISLKLNIPEDKLSKFNKISEKIDRVGPFLNEIFAPGPINLDEAYKITNDPFTRVYSQFTSEQTSHEFSDYLLQDKSGKIQRWRLFSAVWGDEIIPIAKALRKSGNHHNVVYIGTSGALEGKGLKVGDLVSGSKVLTHSGKILNFSPGNLVEEKMRNFTIGQVHTPFNETDHWLKKNKSVIDVVEVETGYLREYLGTESKLQAYFLISDIVGSSTETLAHASSNSSKRKKSLLKLIEGLFQESEIKSPIANFELIKNNASFNKVLRRIQQLRSSRDLLSQKQLAHLAINSGIYSDNELEILIKSQPSFDRSLFSKSLNVIDRMLYEIQKKLPAQTRIGLNAPFLFNGTFNPKLDNEILIVADNLSTAELKQKIGPTNWRHFKSSLPKNIKIKIISDQTPEAIIAIRHFYKRNGAFLSNFEQVVMKPFGYTLELDNKAQFRAKELPGLDLKLKFLKCNQIFM